jgi:glyoxylase-like metal-dependent hydrolase (beta-lactamase superfamily II)
MPATFTIHEAASGVWAAVAPGTAGPAVSNAAIIDLGDKTVVVDTFMTVLAAEELRGEVLRLTGRAPFLVVNSHWHSDHVYGNQVFAPAPIVGTKRMLELIIEDAPTPADTESYIEYLRTTAKELASSSAEDRKRADGTLALAEALAAGAANFQLTPPDVLVGDRLDIRGERSLTVLGYGKGHTESDLFIHLPQSGVVVAGDLVWTAMHPKTDDGFPAEWAAVVDRIADLKPSAVVAGHGQLGTAADVAAVADYMRQLDAMVAAVAAGDLDAATADPPTGSEDWQGLPRFRAGLAKLAASPVA